MAAFPVEEVLCARCARLGKSCCQNREIYLTPADVHRIAAFTQRHDFTEWRAPDDPAYGEQSDDPVWDQHVFHQGHKRRILKKGANGDCTFLGPAGCLLPEAVRPLVCRLHPFTYTAAGLDPEPSPDCPRQLLPAGMNVFAALQLTVDQALAWHRQLYEEILKEDDADDRPDL
jgi:Fe-S-cluster containining protein